MARPMQGAQTRNLGRSILSDIWHNIPSQRFEIHFIFFTPPKWHNFGSRDNSPPIAGCYRLTIDLFANVINESRVDKLCLSIVREHAQTELAVDDVGDINDLNSLSKFLFANLDIIPAALSLSSIGVTISDKQQGMACIAVCKRSESCLFLCGLRSN